MRFVLKCVLFILASSMPVETSAQTVTAIAGPDERFKTDILVVVAHPDDEGAVTPYLSRAIYDLHKKVTVVYATRGGSGGNDYRHEHGPALANVREMEARQACAKLGVTNVWFLDGKDTASQNVLNSLANWGHGANLEKIVGLVRLTRPEVILTFIPSIFVGENHGDHQAAGLLATEAFDLAADPAVFPAQIAGTSKRLEPYLENLVPWQPKKLYYFTDANDEKQFAGTGPAYSIKEVSPSQKKPYWRLALDAATPHRTQFGPALEELSKLSETELEKKMSEPDAQFWTDPETLIFGKSPVTLGKPADVTEDIFAHIEPGPVPPGAAATREKVDAFARGSRLELGDPWRFYTAFRLKHALDALPLAKEPEIAVSSGSLVRVPLIIRHENAEAMKITLNVVAPSGWKVTRGQGEFSLPAEQLTALNAEVQTPQLSPEELKKAKPEEVVVTGQANGKSLGEVKLRVVLRKEALPQ